MIQNKDKTFEDHLRDVQDEFKSGEHRLKWERIKDHESFRIWRSENEFVDFVFWKKTKYHSYNNNKIRYYPKDKFGDQKGSFILRHRKRLKNDKEYCQNWYLEWLAKERLNEPSRNA